MDAPQRDNPNDRAALTTQPRGSHEAGVAWALVGIQFVLIALILLLPRGDSWSLPTGLATVAVVGTWMGVCLMILAAVSLRRGLTAVPLPNAHAKLRTHGLYRFVRHPIYTGLLLLTASLVLNSRSVAAAIAGAALVVLLNVKARWEERRLDDQFADYRDYARTTPRFVPGWPTG